MNVTEDFLPKNIFKKLQKYCDSNEFQIVKAGEKEFSVLPTPENILPFLQIEGHELILSFIRSANKDFDNELRIHADNIIEGKKTALASVLYINSNKEMETNGTAFWRHRYYGLELPENVTNEEFDRLLTEDSNNQSKWLLQGVLFAEPNKQLVYNANLFHSKWPQVIEVGTRVVLVCFYEKFI